MSVTKLDLIGNPSGNGHLTPRGGKGTPIPVRYDLQVFRKITEALPGEWIDSRLRVIRGTVVGLHDETFASRHVGEYFTLILSDNRRRIDFSFKNPEGSIATPGDFYSESH